eukprot:gene13676-3997_t
MVHSYGLRSGTRNLFSKKFGTYGNPAPAKTLKTYRVGDYVDVKADPSVRKGMPHKYYHGRTGIVWNVTPRGVGVIVNKKIRYWRLIPPLYAHVYNGHVHNFRRRLECAVVGRSDSWTIVSSRGDPLSMGQKNTSVSSPLCNTWGCLSDNENRPTQDAGS